MNIASRMEGYPGMYECRQRMFEHQSNPTHEACVNEASQLTTITVRTLLAHFHSTLEQARQTGEPVIIALRRRKPAGVLLGYETWQALTQRQPAQADTSALRAELAAERQRNGELAADLTAARRQVEELSRDLAAARQRVAELEAQLARPPMASQRGDAWGVEPLPAPAHEPPETWPSQTWGISWNAKPPRGSGWGQQ
jgi:PHD/YefM family antitoxin component YafN of YafNO toxin-antitoxin module